MRQKYVIFRIFSEIYDFLVNKERMKRIIYYQCSRNTGEYDMKLSTRTRYAIRAILQLADNFGKGPLQTRIIAQQQDISVKYLEQLMAALKSAGLVTSQRGAKGGYVLARTPDQIKLSEVFDVFEGPVVTVECVSNENYCTKAADCIARQVWSEVQRAVKNVLQSITLADALDKAKKGWPANYQI